MIHLTAELLATQRAEQLLRDLDITALDVDPVVIATRHKILVQPKSTAGGISGLLMKVGDHFGIMYSTQYGNEGYERFSIAHELGHYFLPGHIDAVMGPGGIHESRAGFVSADRYEKEADHFAAGLLMPKHLFVPALATAGKGLSAVEHLRSLCKTSLTATAIRLTQCTPDPIAVVVSTGSQINYCFMSDELREIDGIDWIKKGQIVPRNTATFQFNQDDGNVQGAKRTSGTSDIQDWFGGRRAIEVSEDVVGLGRFGKTLTVLYDMELPDEEEEADEADLSDSWTPRFRR
jgi:Zn-dependent peptidase ImmA (M78 family)